MTQLESRTIDFKVIRSLDTFFYSNKFVSLVVGPVGSTKTTAGIMRIVYCASRMAPCHDGIRRSRAIWIRNTREQLRDTSIPDFLKWLPDGIAGTYYKTDYKFVLRLGDVECEVLFRGLDDANDVRRLLSLQASFAILDEFREINPNIFNTVQGRLGRYPDAMMNGVGCRYEDGTMAKAVWGMTNPPDMDTWWEGYISNPPPNASITIQPSGLSQEADWLKFLDPDYYDNLAQGKTEDWIDVYIHAKVGKSLSGQPVFKSFSRDVHVSKEPLKLMRSTAHPLIIGVDAGLSPAAVIAQLDYTGRLLVYRAVISEGMGALRFIREKLKPMLTNEFAGMPTSVVIDPAAMQRAQTDERSVVDIFRAEGFVVRPAYTNTITARLAAVDSYLTRMTEGKPAVLLCPTGAAPLVQALAGKYRYKVKTSGEMEDKPEKSHPWSDIADAFQYACLHADGGTTFGMNALTSKKREVKPAPVRWAS